MGRPGGALPDGLVNTLTSNPNCAEAAKTYKKSDLFLLL